MIADSPFRQLAWGNFVYGGPLAVLPSVLLIALLAPLVSYRRRDALLLLVPLGIWSCFGPSAAGYRGCPTVTGPSGPMKSTGRR